MKRARKDVPFILPLFILLPVLYFFLPISSESSDPSVIDALAPIETVAEGFKEPTGLAVDSSGALFVSDRKSGEVFKLNGQIHSLVSNLKNPVGLGFDTSGRLLIVEERTGRLLRLEGDGSLTVLAQGMKKPRWVAVAEDGALFITAQGLKSAKDKDDEDEDEEQGEVILRLTAQGSLLTIFAEGFKGLQGIVIQEGTIFAASEGLKQEKNDNGGIFKIPIQNDGKAGPATRVTQINIKKPFGLALDDLGVLYVTAEELEFSKKIKDAIGKVVTDGTLSRFASQLEEPRGLVFDGSGNLYVTDGKGEQHGRVLRLRAPPPPTLVFPSFASQNPLLLNGKTDSNSRIDAFVNNSINPITVSTEDGSFTLTLNLTTNNQNLTTVFTTSHNGQGLTSAPAEITIVHDNIAPVISNLQPLSGSFLNTRTPLISADFMDTGSGVETARVKVQLDGADVIPQALTPSGFTFAPSLLSEALHTVSIIIFDRAGNFVSASTSFTIDVTPPDTQITSGPLGEIGETSATFTFTGTDNLTPAGSLQFSWRLDGGTWSAFSYNTTATFTGLSAGTHFFEVEARDLAGNEDSSAAFREVSVVLGPVITAFSPGSGTLGSEVAIQGRGFDPTAGKTVVRLNGVQAVITSISQTSIRTTVPIGVTTGRITVETPKGIAFSGEDFIVLLRQDFALSISPSIATVVQGGSASYAVRIISTGIEPFTGLANVAINGLPTGPDATLSPSTLGPSATGILNLSSTSATPVGSNAIELRATAQIEGRPITRTALVTLGVQAPGQTILAGEVRDENERPLAGVSIKQGGSILTDLGMTDAGGNFFIPLSVTGPQVFLIDGSTGNTPTVNYSTIPVTLDIQPNVVNILGFIPHLHAQPVAKLTPITPGQGTVLTHPDVPGFTMTIPPGAEIIGWDGKANTRFSVTAVPIDRSPLPSPPADVNASVLYLFSFGKVGGGIPTGNIPIDSPNDIGGIPGETVDLYYFNEAPDGTAPNQWEWYGTGTVSSDGTRIITDINPATGHPYGFPRFCCGALLRALRVPPRPGGGQSGGQSGSGQTAGEPVDTATGFFYLDKTDMVLPGILPIAISRTYRTNLTNAGPFGLGTSWPYDIFLQPPPNNSPDSLILFTPGNHQDLFARQSDGSFVNATSPPLRGAVVTVVGEVRSLRFKDGSLWRFDSAGRLISQADRNGNTITLARDSQSRVTQITEPSGRSLTISYTSFNLRIDSIRDPIGREVRYGYDGSGRLISVTDPAGGITRYTYDGANRMVSITDPRNITFLVNEYDGAGRVIRQTQADGGVWTFAYTASGDFISQTVVTDPRGNSTAYRFNSSGFLTSQTDALGQTTTFERQPGTNLALSTTDPLGRVARFSYDANGNVTTITDPAGNVRRFEYEPVFNKLTKVTDPLEQVTSFEYDTRGNLIATVDPMGARTTIAYNIVGQPVSTTDPLGNTTAFAYDDFGNLTTIADPLGNKTQRAYDLVSRLIEQTDPRGRSSRFSYDGLNRVTQITDALAGLTQFAYDGNGNLLAVTDAKAQTTAYTYDVMDHLASRTDALKRIERYEYDSNGNLTRFTDRKAQVTTFIYDALNRRKQASYADGSRIDSVYDAIGRLTHLSDSLSGAINFAYDNLNRLIQEITAQGSVSYTYDVLGRRTSMRVNGQSPVSYNYDSASRLTQVSQSSQVVGLGYDLAGRRTALTYPNGTDTSYTYDPASRLTRILHQGPASVIEDLTYTYDAGGNRISFGRSGPQAALPAAVQAAYDAANQQIQFNSAGPNLAYDANGNLTSQTDASGTTFYTWDARNRLVGISGLTLSASFAYDALGRRVSKTINGVKTEYQYDGNDITSEFVSGVATATYLRSLTIDDPFIRQSSSNEYYHADALGSVLALTDQNGALQTNYAYDLFGSAAIVGPSTSPFQYTGRENDVTGLYYYRARYYSPTNERFLTEDPMYSPLFNTSNCLANYSPSISRIIELDRGLAILLRFRFFRAASGLTPNPQQLHLYAYANNDPVDKADPTGLRADPQTPGCDVVGGLPGFGSPCAVKCCNAHDRCFEQARFSFCDQTTWLEMIFPYGKYGGKSRLECYDCNRTVARCIVKCGVSGSRKD